mgnify:CR=1 FL=1
MGEITGVASRRVGAWGGLFLLLLAFSPKVDAARVARWQRALEAMKRDGSLQRLKQRWHIDRTASSSNC